MVWRPSSGSDRWERRDTIKEDQLGVARPYGLTCDIGAFEYTIFTNLLQAKTEAAGAKCSAGGTRIEQGLDTNQNGKLADTEVQADQTLCAPPAAAGKAASCSVSQIRGTGSPAAWASLLALCCAAVLRHRRRLARA